MITKIMTINRLMIISNENINNSVLKFAWNNDSYKALLNMCIIYNM